MRLLLIYPPFCTPTIVPYSISALKASLKPSPKPSPKASPKASLKASLKPELKTKNFIKSRIKNHIRCLDLNAKFHKLKFARFYDELKNNPDDYFSILSRFNKESKKVYLENNKNVLSGKDPEYLNELIDLVKQQNPTHVGISIVYSSQVFYAKAIIDALTSKGIACITGGPAVSLQLKKISTYLPDGVSLAKHLDMEFDMSNPDFSDYDLSDYLTPKMIMPIKTSAGCHYANCTFCTHHKNISSVQFPISKVIGTGMECNKFCFIDDMIPLDRLLKISSLMSKIAGARWWVQLKPSRELIPYLKKLYDSGLRCVAWGVESGSQQVLKDMRKGTTPSAIHDVIKASYLAGIINIAYILFGFPTETKDDLNKTLVFLKQNSSYIDLISTSTFGLQKGSYIYEHPKEFGIKIHLSKRTLLDDKITYSIDDNIDNLHDADGGKEQMHKIKRFKKQLVYKYPKIINVFKEQILNYKS